MVLSPNALTSLDAVKSYLKAENQTIDNERLEFLINGCSNVIEDHCKRKFKEQSFTDEEYDGTGSRYLNLKQFPVKSISSVTIDGVQIDSSQYKVKKDSGILVRVGSEWPVGDINISVSYIGGYSEIPYAVELACKHYVKALFNADIASFSTTFQEGFVFRPEALPAQVKAILQPYKKVV